MIAIHYLSFAAVVLGFVSLSTTNGELLYHSLDSTPSDLQVSLFDASIVVSAGNKLYRFNPDFSLSSTVMNQDWMAGHRIALSQNSTHVLLICKETFCNYYEIYWLDKEILSGPRVINGFDSVPIAIDSSGFYIATSDEISMNIKQLSEESYTIRTYDPAINNNSFYQRQYLEGFVYKDFVYFIARDSGATEITNKVRIVRACHNSSDQVAFDAMYEVVLECGAVSPNSKVKVSNNIVDRYGNAVITISVTTVNETSICSFSFDEIDAEINASYALCSSGRNDSLSIPLAWFSERTCARFSEAVSLMHSRT